MKTSGIAGSFSGKILESFPKDFQYSENVVVDVERNIMVSYADIMDVYKSGDRVWHLPQYGKINVPETLGMFEKQKEDMEETKRMQEKLT